MHPPNIVDTTFLTQLGGRTDISEHLNRISNKDAGKIYSTMTNKGPASQAGSRE